LWFSLGIPDGSRIQRNPATIEAEGINHDPKCYQWLKFLGMESTIKTGF